MKVIKMTQVQPRSYLQGPTEMKITEVIMECPGCSWEGPIIDCDAYDPDVDEVGILRCPVCGEVVHEKKAD